MYFAERQAEVRGPRLVPLDEEDTLFGNNVARETRRDNASLCIALKYFTFYNLFNELSPELCIVLERREVARHVEEGFRSFSFSHESCEWPN